MQDQGLFIDFLKNNDFYQLLSRGIFLCFLILMLVEAWFFLLLWESKLQFFYYCLIHLFTSSMSISMFLLAKKYKLDLKFHALNTVLIVFLGPFSGFIALLTACFFIYFKARATPLKQLLGELNPDVTRTKSEMLYQALKSKMIASPTPEADIPINYYDIAQLGTTKQKQVAIAKMLRYFRPSFAPILFELINDEVNCIRVLAATAINTIDQKYTELIQNQEKIVEKHPEKIKELKKLAVLLEIFLYMEILDEEREIKIKTQTLSVYEKYYQLVPDDTEAVVSLAKLYEQSDRENDAIKILEKAKSKNQKLSSEGILLYAELIFYSQNYKGLREILDNIEADSEESGFKSIEKQEIEEIKKIWEEGVNVC